MKFFESIESFIPEDTIYIETISPVGLYTDKLLKLPYIIHREACREKSLEFLCDFGVHSAQSIVDLRTEEVSYSLGGRGIFELDPFGRHVDPDMVFVDEILAAR